MSIQGMALSGLSVNISPEVNPLLMSFKLVLLGILSILAVYIFPRVPYWFDDFIDRIVVIDFTEVIKEQISKVFRWTVYIITFYFAFYILGFTNVHTNPFFQLFILFYGIKTSIAILKPSVSRIDQRINDIQVSEGSILMKILVLGIYVIGLFIALTIFGLRGALTTALAGAGVLGLVIGFGAKDLVSNTLSGIFIAIDQPFRVGDIIEIKGEVGEVTDMGVRTTEIESFDNKVIVIPNMSLINNAVTNYTANSIRRISVKIGIDYDSDMEKSFNVLEEALNSVKQKSGKKDVEVLLDEFADSAIVLEGRLWINQRQNSFVKTKSNIRKRVIEKFREEGVEIPFPTRVIIEE